MKIVNLTCPGCGARLEVGMDRKMAFCSYCGAEELVRRGRLGRFLQRQPKEREDRPRMLPPNGGDRQEDRPPLGVINTVSGGPQRGKADGSEGPAKKQRTSEPVTFTEADAQGIRFPHNDAVVISLNVADYDVRRVLVDNGSSADIVL